VEGKAGSRSFFPCFNAPIRQKPIVEVQKSQNRLISRADILLLGVRSTEEFSDGQGYIERRFLVAIILRKIEK